VWQVLIPEFPAIRTRRCSSFAEANRPKTAEVANIPGAARKRLVRQLLTESLLLSLLAEWRGWKFCSA
jgi:hypothetical protein